MNQQKYLYSWIFISNDCGFSSVGRALDWRFEGHVFDPTCIGWPLFIFYVMWDGLVGRALDWILEGHVFDPRWSTFIPHDSS